MVWWRNLSTDKGNNSKNRQPCGNSYRAGLHSVLHEKGNKGIFRTYALLRMVSSWVSNISSISSLRLILRASASSFSASTASALSFSSTRLSPRFLSRLSWLRLLIRSCSSRESGFVLVVPVDAHSRTDLVSYGPFVLWP